MNHALEKQNISRKDITHWSVHPGGKKILQAIEKSLSLPKETFDVSYRILRDYGNMSSPTILFVLKQILATLDKTKKQTVFGAAFGPGLTMETFLLSS